MGQGIAGEREIDLGGSGTPGVFVPPADDNVGRAHPTRMDEIIAMLDDPEATDLEALNKMIALEIAYALTDPKIEFNPRAVNERVKALRELSKTLQEGENISKKDFLNFDGPKFKFVLGELVLLFRTSLKQSGQPEDSTNHCLRVFRDLLIAREPELRKETERVAADSALSFGVSPTPAAPLLPEG